MENPATSDNQLKTILKNKQDDKISLLLEPLNDKERYDIVWHQMVKKISYFTVSNFSIILPMCKLLKRQYVVEYLLINDRFDLVQVFIDNKWKLDQKFIDKQINFYDKYSKPRKNNPNRIKHESDSSDTDDEEREHLKNRGIKTISWLQNQISAC